MNVRKLIQQRMRRERRVGLFVDASSAIAARGDDSGAAATTRGDELTDEVRDDEMAVEPEAGAQLAGPEAMSLANGGVPLNAAVAADGGADETTADPVRTQGADADDAS